MLGLGLYRERAGSVIRRRRVVMVLQFNMPRGFRSLRIPADDFFGSRGAGDRYPPDREEPGNSPESPHDEMFSFQLVLDVNELTGESVHVEPKDGGLWRDLGTGLDWHVGAICARVQVNHESRDP